LRGSSSPLCNTLLGIRRIVSDDTFFLSQLDTSFNTSYAHLADYDRFGRADLLFAKDKAIGAPLISLHAVPDLPKHVQERLFFVRFEDLMAQPVACMSHIYNWLGLSPLTINANQLEVGVQESDSHYHMKYTHQQATRITAPKRHEIPPRIQALIETAYSWYYQLYYPQLKK